MELKGRHRDALFFCLDLIEFPNPDIPETDRFARIAVGLELDGRAIVLFVRRLAYIFCLTLQLKMILHHHTIEKHCDIGWSF